MVPIHASGYRAGDRELVLQASGALLVETARRTGMDAALAEALAPWRTPRAVHDPGKILLDLTLAIALGGDCRADADLLRADPSVFGPIASDPAVSRLVDTLAAAGPHALAAVRGTRSDGRQRVWRLVGQAAPDAGCDVIVDVDGALVLGGVDLRTRYSKGRVMVGR